MAPPVSFHARDAVSVRARALAGQALRYGLAGIALAALYSGIYWLLAVRAGVPPQRANAVAFLVNLVAGWLLHSRFSFRGHGLPGRALLARLNFVAINLAGYGLNALWVWLVVRRLGQPAGWAVLPIVTVTPAFNFLLNRLLVFRLRLSPDMERAAHPYRDHSRQ